MNNKPLIKVPLELHNLPRPSKTEDWEKISVPNYVGFLERWGMITGVRYEGKNKWTYFVSLNNLNTASLMLDEDQFAQEIPA